MPVGTRGWFGAQSLTAVCSLCQGYLFVFQWPKFAAEKSQIVVAVCNKGYLLFFKTTK